MKETTTAFAEVLESFLEPLTDAIASRVADKLRLAPSAEPAQNGTMTVKEAAFSLGFSEQVVRDMCASKKLVAWKRKPESRTSPWVIDAESVAINKAALISPKTLPDAWFEQP